MASWTTPYNVSNGDILTESLWNNLLGENGSLQYIYDNKPILENSVAVIKSTNTTVAAVNVTINFNTLVSYGNITTITPTIGTTVSLDGEGLYVFTFMFRPTAAVNRIYYASIIPDGANTIIQSFQCTTALLTNFTMTTLSYIPSSSAGVSVALRSNSSTGTAIATSSFPSPSQMLIWKKIKGL